MIAAVVPAAGESRRMGRPKLLLPVGGTPLIRRVVAALAAGGAAPVVVVLPPRDRDETSGLAVEVEAAGGLAVFPGRQPPDMRASFEWGLAGLEALGVPPATVLLTPADAPALTAAIVARVVAEARRRPDRIVVPTHSGKRGHPVALPWTSAVKVRTLPEGLGVNALLGRDADTIMELPCDDRGILEDLDTPEDYRRWQPGRD